MYSTEELSKDQMTIMPDGTGFWNIHGRDTSLSENVRAMIPLQYTDRFDINNVEICEKDVIEYTYENGEGVCGQQLYSSIKRTVLVYYHKGVFCNASHSGGKIIGNVYENPELKELL